MAPKTSLKSAAMFVAVAVAIAGIVVACSSAEPDAPLGAPEKEPTATTGRLAQPSRSAAQTTPTPTSIWLAVLQRTPFPYTTPLPPADATALDGTYTRIDPSQAERVPCRRCPPYPPEGGLWKLNFDRGIFRVFHSGTRWRTVGSFMVSGDRLLLFNDPHCYEDLGTYLWKLEEGQLVLEAVEDNCGTHLRVQSLAQHPWLSCQPPGTEAAVTDHWPVPPGCQDEGEGD